MNNFNNVNMKLFIWKVLNNPWVTNIDIEVVKFSKKPIDGLWNSC